MQINMCTKGRVLHVPGRIDVVFDFNPFCFCFCSIVSCGKYRFNKLDLGTIADTGLPRVLDVGQCNDVCVALIWGKTCSWGGSYALTSVVHLYLFQSYGAAVIAMKLAEAFGTDVNGLPLSFAVSWFEQKVEQGVI